MSNSKFQKCSHLQIDDYYNMEDRHLDKLMQMQSDIQKMYFEKHGRKQFDEMTLRELCDFLLLNKHSLDNEFHEFFDALGGINDGIGNAIWKHWKSDNKQASEMTLADLSDDDLTELHYEWIDALHFFLIFGISIGITPERMFNLYVSKNKENYARQRNEY